MPRSPLRRLAQRLLRSAIRVGLSSVRFVFWRVPRKWGLACGAGLGWIAYLVLRRERRRALTHLSAALGGDRSPRQLRRIARDSFLNLGRTFFEALTLDRLTRADLDRWVRFEGEETLQSAAAAGRGVIFVTAHLGNWELMGAAVAQRHRLAVVAAPIYDPGVEQVMIGLRSAHGIETLVRDTPGMLRRLLTCLREGGVVGILIDQDTRTDGVYVPFFHAEAYTPAGAANLALRTGAAVVAGFIHRESDGRHRIVIHGPLPVAPTGDHERDVRDHTAQWSRLIEDEIRRAPEQWVWMHRRWRRSPQEIPPA